MAADQHNRLARTGLAGGVDPFAKPRPAIKQNQTDIGRADLRSDLARVTVQGVIRAAGRHDENASLAVADAPQLHAVDYERVDYDPKKPIARLEADRAARERDGRSNGRELLTIALAWLKGG